MKKFLTLLLIVAITPLIGGIYGIVHDQLTYSISHEYYTKFKFYQFGLMDVGNEAIFPNPRIEVSAVGFLATWWMGVPIGLVLGLVGAKHKTTNHMVKATFGAIVITIVVAFATGLVGFVYGKYYLAKTGVDWWLPDNLIDKENFIAVGSMHNFSYIGGVLGLIAGTVYSVWRKRKFTLDNTQSSS